MDIDPKIVELMNADIDGEISEEGRATLTAHLDNDPEAKSLYEELAGLCAELDGLEIVAPPPHLSHAITAAIAPERQPESSAAFIGNLFGNTSFRHAVAFAAGVVLTYAFVSSNRISDHTFDDITDLVGTISRPDSNAAQERIETISLTGSEIAGTVSLRRSGALMVLDFDLMAEGPVQVVAAFDDPDIWFNGFAQLEGDGTRVAVETGRVTLTMEGQRRYAVYLHNASRSSAIISLRFYSSGDLVFEQALTFGEATD